MERLKDLNETYKKTVIMVTHNIDYVRYGSRTINIRDGAVVDPADHFRNPDPTLV
jgi:putative ABC transport system ATP-binding protein